MPRPVQGLGRGQAAELPIGLPQPDDPSAARRLPGHPREAVRLIAMSTGLTSQRKHLLPRIVRPPGHDVLCNGRPGRRDGRCKASLRSHLIGPLGRLWRNFSGFRVAALQRSFGVELGQWAQDLRVAELEFVFIEFSSSARARPSSALPDASWTLTMPRAKRAPSPSPTPEVEAPDEPSAPAGVRPSASACTDADRARCRSCDGAARSRASARPRSSSSG